MYLLLLKFKLDIVFPPDIRVQAYAKDLGNQFTLLI